MYVCMHSHACVCMNACKGMSTHIRVHAYACMYVCMRMYDVCMCMYICVDAHV